MIPRVIKESFTETSVPLDGEDVKAYSIYLEFPESNPMTQFGPRGEILGDDLLHFVEVAPSKAGDKDVWFWGHGAKAKEGDAMELLWTMQYSSFEESIFETNVYLLFWALKANLFTLWVRRSIPCYIDDASHAAEFTDESVMGFLLAGPWAMIEGAEEEDAVQPELKHAITSFDNYIKLGIFLKDCGVMAGLEIKDNPYKTRLLQDFQALAKRKEERYQ